MPVTATLYQSELERLAAYVNDYPRLETGGELRGFVTRSGSPVVTLVTGPGYRARHEHAAFFQDVPVLERRAAFLFRQHGLYQLGNWHSHHSLGLRVPSTGDDETVKGHLPALGWPTFLMGLGNVEGAGAASFGFYTYDAKGHRFDTELTVLPRASPFERLASMLPGGVPPRSRRVSCVLRKPARAWFQQDAVARRLAREVRGLDRLEAFGWSKAEVQLRAGAVHVSIAEPRGCRFTATLAEGFPALAPRVRVDAAPATFTWRSDELLASHLAELSAEMSPGVTHS